MENEAAAYGILRGLRGAYMPDAHIGPFETEEHAREALEEQREQDMDAWHTQVEEYRDEDEKPTEIQEVADTAASRVAFYDYKGQRIELIKLDEELKEDWEEAEA